MLGSVKLSGIVGDDRVDCGPPKDNFAVSGVLNACLVSARERGKSGNSVNGPVHRIEEAENSLARMNIVSGCAQWNLPEVL